MASKAETARSLAKRRLNFGIVSVSLIFVWFLAIQGIGTYLFSTGFLLSRTELSQKSSTDTAIPPKFSKAIVVLIDALRYDFTVPAAGLQCHNHLTALNEIASDSPNNAILLKFLSDPPTTTLQRLKGLTTGSLPTFIEAGSNFDGTSINSDSWIYQLHTANKTIAFMGDDTWIALYPDSFYPPLTFPYESFNVWDLHTLDEGVISHLYPLLDSTSPQYDVLIAHFLGVDHAGHRYGPNHPEMASKLDQMDSVVRKIVSSIDDDTLLIVMGDHGMDSKGDHGGDSQLEIESALFMYSKKPVFHPSNHGLLDPDTVSQIDLVPTISLLLGLPIPYGNLGKPISNCFVGTKGNDHFHLAQALFASTSQIKEYHETYVQLSSASAQVPASIVRLWDKASSDYQKCVSSKSSSSCKTAVSSLEEYSNEILRHYQKLWIRFDYTLIIIGLITLALGIASLSAYLLSAPFDTWGSLVIKILSFGSFGIVAVILFLQVSGMGFQMPYVLFGFSLASFLGCMKYLWHKLRSIKVSFWNCFAALLTVFHLVLFASNSFTIWEDRVSAFLVATAGLVMLIASFVVEDKMDRFLCVYQSLIFTVLTRLSAFSTLCREEQGQYCLTTFYDSGSSVTTSPYILGSLFAISIILPEIVANYYRRSDSFRESAPIIISMGLRGCLLFIASYWLCEAGDNQNWLEFDAFKSVKFLLGQSVLFAALIVGTVYFYQGPVCIAISLGDTKDNAENAGKPIVRGFANVYGSLYTYSLLIAYVLVALFTKPVGGITLAAMLWQILCLVDIIDILKLNETAFGPVVLGLLGNLHFFTTGHQATIPSVQWDMAFALTENISFPLSHLSIIMNSLGSYILSALAVPLFVFWNFAPKKGLYNALLWHVSRACAYFLLYHSVVSFSSFLFAAYFRRHLMVWKIFAPRYMLAGISTIAVYLTTVFGALATATAITLSSVTALFG
ncbi:hypothetical protein CANCADRAFT_73720 [Tortispora caseinolytica NRRL Y-17796]|uniref:Uncharacterized protein n=1 Tax=Tortispora caseinolytica NRRL Y-17796 TaxID=767744 RepID=A0A1E4TIT5_9ASCO|nr:hypothetical protein CANCADRAFT_73720 [Tortispora caseinolytica NRRL Y-17796]